jgi:alkylation response protein AidB-like acyl-CoA dehydrogenase
MTQEIQTDMQRMLRASLEKLLARHYGFEQRQKLRKAATWSEAAWRDYAELGLFGLGVDEADGGIGGSLEDLGIVADAMGAALALDPLIPTMAFGARLIAAGTDKQKAALLPGIVAGACRVALAHEERHSRYDLDIADCAAVAEQGGYRLDGRKIVSIGADAADLLMVTARVAGGQALSLFLVPADSPGLTRRNYATFDGTGAADVTLEDVRVPADALLGGPDEGPALLAQAVAEAVALDCMDAVGAMRAANALTLEHVRTRRQFGVAIGSFQVVQHRLVDMAIAQEMAAAIAAAAVTAAARGAPDERDRMVSAAKVRVVESARFVAQQTVQLHGGMGLTEDYPASHYFARLGMFERRWGDSEYYLQRFAAGMAEA